MAERHLLLLLLRCGGEVRKQKQKRRKGCPAMPKVPWWRGGLARQLLVEALPATNYGPQPCRGPLSARRPCLPTLPGCGLAGILSYISLHVAAYSSQLIHYMLLWLHFLQCCLSSFGIEFFCICFHALAATFRIQCSLGLPVVNFWFSHGSLLRKNVTCLVGSV